LNTYGYVLGNPNKYIDPYGLDPWTFDGQGDISICSYYSELAKQNPKCGYLPEAFEICRGEHDGVNALTTLGMMDGWRQGGQDSQSEILTNIREILVAEDMARRGEGLIDENGCTCGNDIDEYHNFAFDFSGIPSYWYGGNILPQSSRHNPVPVDPRNAPPPNNEIPTGPIYGP